MASKQPQKSPAKKPGASTDTKRTERIERNADKKRLRKQNRRMK